MATKSVAESKREFRIGLYLKAIAALSKAFNLTLYYNTTHEVYIVKDYDQCELDWILNAHNEKEIE